jgi:putative membrane-bound dehydrogenase-like protein
MIVPIARDTVGKHDARFEDGVALYLPGVDGRVGFQPPQPAATNPFSGTRINRSAHFAGGRLRSKLALDDQYSIELWLWNGLPVEARAVTGYVYSRGPDGDKAARGEHLGIGGTYRGDLTGKLILFNGNERNELLVGRTKLALRAWHHVVLVREGGNVRVHLDGRAEPEITGAFEHTVPTGEASVFLGGRNDGMFNFEGKLDEVAIYPRPLAVTEIAAHYKVSALTPPVAVARATPPPVSRPLSPLESLKSIQVRDGYRVELVAAEPLTLDPVAIDWDPAGRLWVVEMADYPLGMDGKGKPGGRVRVLEDLDGDGRYNKQTLFADGLSFPTGLLTWRDGVLVTAAPEVLFLRDTDGDGHADSREVLVSGLTTGNQQLRANGLRWGLDGWVYCAAGGHHGEYGTGTRLRTRLGDVLVGSRDFRFRPDTGELEPQSGPSQFGRNRDDWGHWFGTQNSRPLWHYVLADHYLRRNPHVAAPDPTRQVVIPLNPKVWPVSPPEKRFHSFENAGHFTSACSGMIYRDELLFPRSENEMHAFTCEPFHNLVQRNVITSDGVTFQAHRAAGEEKSEFFASEDRWCRPVMTRTGPDGALWVVDMYRYMIEHPDWLPPEGRAELLPHYRLGDDRGRIYRVFPADQAPRKITNLERLTAIELVAALDSPNEWQRDQAQMLLAWRGDRSLAGPLRKLAAESVNPLARLHALCVLDHLDALTPATLTRALRDDHPGVRENALRLAESRSAPEVINAAAKLADDPEPKVRLQLAFTLGAWTNATAGETLSRLAVKDQDDPFMLAAIMSSAGPHVRALAEGTLKSGPNGPLRDSLANLALALNDRATLASLLTPILSPKDGNYAASQFEASARFLNTLGKRKTPVASLASGDDALALLLRDRMNDHPDSILSAAHRIAGDEKQPVEYRSAAIGLMARDESRRSEVLGLLARLLEPRVDGGLQRAAITALATTADPSVSATLLAALPSLPPASRATAFEVLFSREAWAYALVQHLQRNDGVALDAAQRMRLLKHGSKRIRELAGTVLAGSTSRANVVQQFQPALRLAGDTARGRAIFNRVCIVCHKVGETGGEVGPDLKSISSHPPEKLLMNILDPSADIQPGYNAYHCGLVDGTELYGLIASETGTSITFKGADGAARTVLRREITTLKNANVSLMPDGLEAGMTNQDLADLIQFLRAGTPTQGR